MIARFYGMKRPAGRRASRDYVADGGHKELSRRQKGVLCEIARRAAARCGAPEKGPRHAEWRRAEACNACGRRISEGRQRDYTALKAHFLERGGEESAAMAATVQGADNKRRIALWVLKKELRERGLEQGYAEAICARQYKCAVAEANTAQVWRLVFTIKNRRKKPETRNQT